MPIQLLPAHPCLVAKDGSTDQFHKLQLRDNILQNKILVVYSTNNINERGRCKVQNIIPSRISVPTRMKQYVSVVPTCGTNGTIEEEYGADRN